MSIENSFFIIRLMDVSTQKNLFSTAIQRSAIWKTFPLSAPENKVQIISSISQNLKLLSECWINYLNRNACQTMVKI